MKVQCDGLPGRGTPQHRAVLKSAFEGLVKLPGRGVRTEMTLHDPTAKDLQLLIDTMPTAQLHVLEVAVDFCPSPSASTSLDEIYDWLKHTVCPQAHRYMIGARRKQYRESTRKVEPLRGLPSLPERTSAYWTSREGWEQVRLYIKTIDQNKPAGQPLVRLEVTLNGGGTQRANVQLVGHLPTFVKQLQTYLSPLFSIGKGLKPSTKARLDRMKSARLRQTGLAKQSAAESALRKKWRSHGGAYALANDIKVLPDVVANRRVGTALKRLREQLLKLREPNKVADPTSHLGRAYSGNESRSGPLPSSYRSSNRIKTT